MVLSEALGGAVFWVLIYLVYRKLRYGTIENISSHTLLLVFVCSLILSLSTQALVPDEVQQKPVNDVKENGYNISPEIDDKNPELNITEVGTKNNSNSNDRNTTWLSSLNDSVYSQNSMFFMYFKLNNPYYKRGFQKFEGHYRILFNSSTPMEVNIMKTEKFLKWINGEKIPPIQFSRNDKTFNVTRSLLGDNMTIMVFNERGPSGYGKIKILNVSDNKTTETEELLK